MPLWLHCSHPVSITQFQFRFYMNIKVFQYGGLQECNWWLIPLSKRLITPVIGRLTLLIPLITGVIIHLLTGMSHQVSIQSPHSACGFRKHPASATSWGFVPATDPRPRFLANGPTGFFGRNGGEMGQEPGKSERYLDVKASALIFRCWLPKMHIFVQMICSHVQDPAGLLTNFIGFLEDKHVFFSGN